MSTKTAITYAIGDATQPATQPAVIAHVVNDVGGWGAGFSGAVSKRWPEVEPKYRRWYRTGRPPFALGRVQILDVESGLWVANMIAQQGIGWHDGEPPIRYGALVNCLRAVAFFAQNQHASIHMPRIGCGLAGGRWEQVGPLVETWCESVPVFVYDLPEVARHD